MHSYIKNVLGEFILYGVITKQIFQNLRAKWHLKAERTVCVSICVNMCMCVPGS